MKSNKRAQREAKRLFRTCLAHGLLDENRARRTAYETAATGQRDRVPILAHFLRLVRFYAAEHTAAIESAAPLPGDVGVDLRASLARRYGRDLAATFTVHPQLIGGVRIQVGSDVYDGTVRAGLAALEKSF